MKFPFKTIPNGMDVKARDFFVYSVNPKEYGYPNRPAVPSLVGRVVRIEKNRAGVVRYVMVRLIPDFKKRPPTHVDNGMTVARGNNYFLVYKDIPPGYHGISLGPVKSLVAKKALSFVSQCATGLWIPYRPDEPAYHCRADTEKGAQYPWGVAFEKETDAVVFQAFLLARHENPAQDI